MYRLVLGFNRTIKFDKYSKAVETRDKCGGTLYQKIGSYNGRD